LILLKERKRQDNERRTKRKEKEFEGGVVLEEK
jgi:hypothetical protein